MNIYKHLPTYYLFLIASILYLLKPEIKLFL